MRHVVLSIPLLLALNPSMMAAQNCGNSSVGFSPLNDLATGTYQGAQGGLYPGGSNVRPLAHEIGGLRQATRVVPRNAQGLPDPNGRVVVMSLGMSNTRIHWQSFMQASNADPLRSPAVTLVQGAQGGVPAGEMSDPNDPYWTVLPQKLQQAGVAAPEVQVVWFLQANAGPNGPFPQQPQALKGQLTAIMGILKNRLPNVAMVFAGTRIYAGYATTPLNPEPHAYETGFAFKWMIEDQINGLPALNWDPSQGTVRAPWIAWGPYMWADGLVPRNDGLIWECADFNPDGTHPSTQGAQKHAGYLLDFFHNDTAARLWYLAQPEPVVFGQGKQTSLGTFPTTGWVGTPSLTTNDFAVTLTGGVPNKAVVPIFGGRPAQLPFFEGTLFAAPPLKRLPVQILSGAGATFTPVAINPSMMGQFRVYQYWGRDKNHPDGTSVSLSNAMQVLFTP
jgi:hypothetical protein